ncbi:MAG TPA: PAS domain S-box protein [Thermoplasmatales archaeon]|nr:PAS domain S-box protein [Thermoplasmatales archaeon]
MTKYSTISISHELYNKIQEFVKKNPEMGYGSVADFCKEAIRLHVEEIKDEVRKDFLRRLDVPVLIKKIERLSAIDAGLYGKIFEKMKEMVFVLSDDLKIKECNTEFFDSMGYSLKEELIGKDIEEIFDDFNLKHMIKTREFKNYETKAVRKDGKKIDVLLSVARLNGKYVGTAKDITVRNYILDREKKMRELYEYLIDEMCDVVVIIQDKKIRFLNKAITKTGWKREELMGKDFLEFVGEEDRKRIVENYKKSLKGVDLGKPRRYKILTKDGEKVVAEMLSRKIEYEGRPALLVTIRYIGYSSK